MNKPKLLSGKQKAFIDAYLGKANFNATKAAELAGYKGNGRTLATVGYDNLRKPAIKQEIEKRIDELQDRLPGHIINHLKNKTKQKILKEGFVYLIAAPNGLVKIGKSKNVKNRFSDINTSSPVDLKLIYDFFCEDYNKAEKELHEKFAGKRVKGEWFNLSKSDVSWIKNSHKESGNMGNTPTILNYKVPSQDYNNASEQSSFFNLMDKDE